MFRVRVPNLLDSTPQKELSKITNYYGNLHHLGNKSYHYCCQRFKKCDFEITTALEEIKRRIGLAKKINKPRGV